MHLLVRQTPQRAQQRQQQERLLALDAGRTARTSGQRRWTLPLGELDGELTPGEQLETRHERQRIQMERRCHGAMIGWRGNWRLNRTHSGCHEMPPARGLLPRSGGILPRRSQLRNALKLVFAVRAVFADAMVCTSCA